MKNNGKSLFIIMCLLLNGCASIVSDNMKQIAINSSPEDAQVTIVDENGRKIYSGYTPTSVTLQTGEAYFHGKEYTVTFTKDGYSDRTAVISKKLNGWYFGNILFGGVIGMLIVDPMTGAMWTLSPEHLSVGLEAQVALENNNESVLSVMLVEHLPDSTKKELIPIKQ